MLATRRACPARARHISVSDRPALLIMRITLAQQQNAVGSAVNVQCLKLFRNRVRLVDSRRACARPLLDRTSAPHEAFLVMTDAVASSLGSMMVGYEMLISGPDGQAIDGGGYSASCCSSFYDPKR